MTFFSVFLVYNVTGGTKRIHAVTKGKSSGHVRSVERALVERIIFVDIFVIIPSLNISLVLLR